MASIDDRDEAETARLIAGVALADRKAFATLYRQTSGKLFAVCLRMLQDRADAEEALQEIYIKVWNKAGGYRADMGRPMTWLIAIARNHALDLLRRRRQASVELDEAGDIADPHADPEETVVLASEGRRIEECMQQLQKDRAEAVRSAYVEGLSYLELAGLHGVPLNTMRTWLRRSLIKLRECMDR